MTNIGKTKAEIIMELLISLNQGNSGTIADRPYYAIEQYERLAKRGIITKKKNKTPSTDVSSLFRPPVICR